MESILNDELDEVEEPLTDLELADAIRDAIDELNQLRAEIGIRGFTTVLVGEDNIQIFKDVREEI